MARGSDPFEATVELERFDRHPFVWEWKNRLPNGIRILRDGRAPSVSHRIRIEVTPLELGRRPLHEIKLAVSTETESTSFEIPVLRVPATAAEASSTVYNDQLENNL